MILDLKEDLYKNNQCHMNLDLIKEDLYQNNQCNMNLDLKEDIYQNNQCNMNLDLKEDLYQNKYYIYHGSYKLTYLNQRIRRMSWFK
jgi:membrane protein involved in colicin uptake